MTTLELIERGIGHNCLADAYDLGRADAIEEYRKEMHDMIEGDEEFTDWQKYEILECNELVAEQLKEQK